MDRSIVLEIRSLTNLMKREICKAHSYTLDNGTELHGAIIRFIMENNEKEIYQKDFEEKFMMRRSTASRMLQLMEKNGMISRISDEGDARLKKIVLTDKAIAKCHEMETFGKAVNVKMKRNISDTELINFFRVIDKIKANMEE